MDKDCNLTHGVNKKKKLPYEINAILAGNIKPHSKRREKLIWEETKEVFKEKITFGSDL